ncbi:MAG: DoxX family protein [Acidobacteria bacterium]|nr:DoxX family protein [Acidobacteriota bacterium]
MRLLQPYGDHVHAALRIVAGYAFSLHGAQKLLGFPGDGDPVALVSLIGLAGVIELVGGAMIAVGLWTSRAAFLASGEMAVAYFLGHVARSGAFLFPLVNQGEPAVLFCFVFLYFAVRGTGRWGVDGLLARSR